MPAKNQKRILAWRLANPDKVKEYTKRYRQSPATQEKEKKRKSKSRKGWASSHPLAHENVIASEQFCTDSAEGPTLHGPSSMLAQNEREGG